MRLRSPLFAPGDSARKAEKAMASDADCVILDLEDSVAAPAKDAARQQTAAFVQAACVAARKRLIVRVNPLGTDWYLTDLAAVARTAPAAIMLPKCRGAADLIVLDHHLTALEAAAGLTLGGIGVIAIATETAASVIGLSSYADCAPRLLALCFGAEDLSADLGIAPRRPDGTYSAPVAAARAQMLVAAGAAGVPALDTPWPDPRDPDGMVREAAQAAADGFTGKMLIHPGQIEAAQAAFTPPPEQVAWARRVREAFAAAPDSGVLTLDGKMIDRPHLKLADRILSAIGDLPPGTRATISQY
jgi:citrate lyase subunit beta / citryl-CoA lyase